MFESVKEMIIKLEREDDEEEMYLRNSKIENRKSEEEIPDGGRGDLRISIHDP